MVLEHQDEHGSQWGAMRQEARQSPSSIAAKIGCTTETLRRWVRQAEIDLGARGGLTSETSERDPS
jgi:transposase